MECVGESACSLKKKFVNAFEIWKKGNTNNASVRPNLETNYIFNPKDFKILVYRHKKQTTENSGIKHHFKSQHNQTETRFFFN